MISLSNINNSSSLLLTYNRILERIIANEVCTNLIKFSIQNLLELREEKWVPRKERAEKKSQNEMKKNLSNKDLMEKKRKAQALLTYLIFCK